MQTHTISAVRTRVTVAVIVFLLFNLLAASAIASEKESEIVSTNPASRYAEEGGLERRIVENKGSLKNFVKSNLTIVQHRLGNQWIIDQDSLECVSEEMRGDKAGACIVNAKLFGSKESVSMFAILVGESDENGGIQVRKVEFLKQSN